MKPSRRDFLGAAAIALGGGALRRAPQDSRAQARFVGDAFERGHHWLTPDPEKLHVSKKEKKRVVIVGGGIAGVVAAWRLLEAGVDEFVLLELEDKAGGLARNGMIGNVVVPFGGVTMAPPNDDTSPAVRRLLVFAGAQNRQEAGRTFHGVPDDGWCLSRFGARPRDLDPEAVAKDFSLRVRELRVRDGFSALLTPLLAKIGERFQKARVVVLVKPEGSGARVRTVNALDAIVTDFEAEAVVLAVPPFIARRITPALRERDQDVVLPENTPWLVTAFQVSEWPKGFDASIPIHQTTDERATMIVTAGTPPEGVIVAHRPFPASATTPARMFLRDLSPEEARDWSMREIQPVLPDLARVTKRVELWRVGHGSIRPAPGYVTKVAPRVRAPLGPIHPCGADYAGVPSAESAITDGVRGAEAVLAGFGKLDRSWL
jgi:monoamine oxidase